MQGLNALPIPCTKSQVRSFLGMTGYYRDFPAYASHSYHLTESTKESAGDVVMWTDALDDEYC